MKRRNAYGALCSAILSLLTGCSSVPPMVPVTGIVRIEGKPMANVKVCFYPEKLNEDQNKNGFGSAITDDTGTYTIEGTANQQGLFPGNYRVTLSLPVDKQGKMLPGGVKPSEVRGSKNLVPSKYHNQNTTPEIVEVQRTGLHKDFDLTKAE